MNKNAKKIKELIESKFNWDDFTYLMVSEEFYDKKLTKKFSDAIELPVKFMGAERYLDCGEQAYRWVVKIGDHFFKWEGWYCSYEGCSVDDITDFEEVHEVEKTIKVWEKV